MRLLKKAALGVIGGILAVYLLLAVGLTALEWIVRDNPKVEHSLRAHSTDPHRLTHYDQGAASFQRPLSRIPRIARLLRCPSGAITRFGSSDPRSMRCEQACD